MYSSTRINSLKAKRLPQTSPNCLNALISVVDENQSHNKYLTELERTKNAISSIERLFHNLQK